MSIRKQLDDRGTLDVLRHGVELIGLRQPIALAQFRPALAMNADILFRYAANRLRVVRQVRYSSANENCIDLVLFLNGLSTITSRIKRAQTQSNLELLDRGIAFSKINMVPPAPSSCRSQIWIQIYRPREQCCAFLYLADNIRERHSSL